MAPPILSSAAALFKLSSMLMLELLRPFGPLDRSAKLRAPLLLGPGPTLPPGPPLALSGGIWW